MITNLLKAVGAGSTTAPSAHHDDHDDKDDRKDAVVDGGIDNPLGFLFHNFQAGSTASSSSPSYTSTEVGDGGIRGGGRTTGSSHIGRGGGRWYYADYVDGGADRRKRREAAANAVAAVAAVAGMRTDDKGVGGRGACDRPSHPSSTLSSSSFALISGDRCPTDDQRSLPTNTNTKTNTTKAAPAVVTARHVVGGSGGVGMMIGGVYRGRRIVPDITHLYDVVNDREAYENYDALMEIACAAANEAAADDAERSSSSSSRNRASSFSSRLGGRDGGGGGRDVGLEQKRRWARMKEEELVDRMLSQFPEFGTNLPTPFTVMNEGEENEEGPEGKSGGGSMTINGIRGRDAEEDAPRGDAASTSSYPSIKFFPDDATDMIGRFFLGVAANTGLVVPSTVVDGMDFRRTPSFESASTLSSTVGASAAGLDQRRGRRRGDRDIGAADDGSAYTDADGVPGQGDANGDRHSEWDQDEINLWRGGDEAKGSTLMVASPPSFGLRQQRGARDTPGGDTATARSRHLHGDDSPRAISPQLRIDNRIPWDEEVVADGVVSGQTSKELNWVSRRRMHRERQQNRHNWDALTISASDVPSTGCPPWKITHITTALPQIHQLCVFPDREARKQSLSSKRNDKDSQQYNRSKGGGGGAVIVDNGKQHWMPDNICKQCYSCEVPFTVIRRKHHCRVCGMIFCSACSAYFVQISSSDGDPIGGSDGITTIRTCQTCHDQLSERGLGVVIRDQMGTPGNVKLKSDGGGVTDDLQRKSSSEMNFKKSPSLGEEKIPEAVSEATSHITQNASAHELLLPLTSMAQSDFMPKPVTDDNITMSVLTSSRESMEQFNGLRGPGASVSGDFLALSMTKQRLDEEKRQREKQDHSEAEEAARPMDEEKEETKATLAESKMSGITGSGTRLKTLMDSSAQQIKSSFCNADKKILDGGGRDAPANRADSCPDLVEECESSRRNTSDNQPASVSIRAAASTECSSGVEEALSGMKESNDTTAKKHLGVIAAKFLEKLTRELLQTDAPLLLEEIEAACEGSSSASVQSKLITLWVNTLMTLATRCCTTVEPDVRNGDLLDIRPYCKVKIIPGGNVLDFAYVSGVVFHKNVSHKQMARVIPNAKIMILSGGIEYTRTENRIASLDTLLEQEERFMEILVAKICKLKPNILIVGKSVCRKAHELLLRANIVLIQYVKLTLMSRVARQTGATVLSSIDHVMNSTVLGFCRRFRLVSFRDNDVWVDHNSPSKAISSDQKSVPNLLSQSNVPNHVRQAALAARKLGEEVFDGMDAVTSGLAKRGVVQTYVMIEGCAKELGCTAIVRGASRPSLKMVKRVLRFLINAAYNMKLETSYILERCCRLPRTYKIPSTPCCSSSFCVEFGPPPNGRKARPWNGGKNDPDQRSLSGKITALDHQAILITSIWMTETTQCCPAEVKGICYYSMQDVSLGQFLRDSCFNLSLKCQNPSCKKSVLDHSLSFIHNDGMINITVERMDQPIPTSSLQKQQKDHDTASSPPDNEPIATWTFCTKCNQVVTPLVFISKQTWQWSFGKFLEVYFYNRDAIINAPGHSCLCRMQTSSRLFFGCGSLAARFTYEKVAPYSVFCRRHLPFDESFHRMHSLQDLEHISVTSSSLFVKYDRQIDAISRETRELFGSAVNKPEHLQAVLSELNLISAEVDNASKVLQEKISSVTVKFSKADKMADQYEALLNNFPWYCKRYLFMLASAWNERLSAAGQALSAMKKIQYAGGSGRGDSVVVPAIVGDGSTDDVFEGMKRIRMLQEAYARNYNVAKMTLPRSHTVEGGLFEGNILPDGRLAALEQEADIDDEEFYSDPDNEIDFEADIDADVLASRNRVYSPQASSSSSSRISSRKRTKNILNSQKTSDFTGETPSIPDQGPSSLGFANNYDSSGQLESLGKTKTVTAGGAVKSALTRFFNRGGNKEDPYVVDLGFFGMGRPRLQPGISGLVIPVFDDQPSSIIAHSLASHDYDVQFGQYLTASSQPESKSEKHELSRKDIERRMLGRNKSHIKHTFRDYDEKGQQLCKFICTTFWSVQFNAVRQAFMNPHISTKESSGGDVSQGSTKLPGSNKIDIEKSYIRSLATSFAWAASGGKSGAAFSRTTDDRFVIKCISRTELQMFLDCAPAYFEYLNKAFFHGLPTVLCKIVGVYQIGYHNRVTGRRTMDQVAVMQNIFYGRKISKIFDLKGSLRGRFARKGNLDEEKKSRKKSSQYRRKSDHSDSDSSYSGDEDDDDTLSTSSGGIEKDGKAGTDMEKAERTDKGTSLPTLLDGDFLEFTSGRPLPLTDRAKAVFHMSILNDTLFLSIINVLDYSILVGIDEEKKELVVGIIDFMRQYDILKQMERVGKSLPMVVGSEAPTIIQPPLYKTRFTNAMERYFMTVPSKWTAI